MRNLFATAAVLAVAVIVIIVAMTAVPSPARADDMYHSAHISLQAVGDKPLRSGFVENIHANGLTIFAHEIYVLIGAEPETTYYVSLTIFSNDTCSDGGESGPSTAITTNPAGNGRGDGVFRPSDIPSELRNSTHGIIWTVSDSSGEKFRSGCEVVTLD